MKNLCLIAISLLITSAPVQAGLYSESGKLFNPNTVVLQSSDTIEHKIEALYLNNKKSGAKICSFVEHGITKDGGVLEISVTKSSNNPYSGAVDISYKIPKTVITGWNNKDNLEYTFEYSNELTGSSYSYKTWNLAALEEQHGADYVELALTSDSSVYEVVNSFTRTGDWVIYEGMKAIPMDIQSGNIFLNDKSTIKTFYICVETISQKSS
ncbi:hypothetical protein JCM19232_3898 [Vibrio ishigakensis]|uniref:Uncharacterized protein n=1 Tax=Vibrio ishigakensis TaxID=1481914 RepID=A0A0B8P418_9VIBR|nr:hypothetical protein JCM19232_3898 [Vibrio ishigakensis]